MKLDLRVYVDQHVGWYLWKVAQEEKCHPAKLVATMIRNWYEDEAGEFAKDMNRDRRVRE